MKQKRKNLLSLDKSVQIKILKYLKKLNSLDNPRSLGKTLRGNLKNYWRYRVGNYRLIYKIKDDELVILVVDIDHRSKVYNFFSE